MVGAMIGGLFVWIPFLWCYGPAPFQQFALSKADNKISAVVDNLQDDYEIYLGKPVL